MLENFVFKHFNENSDFDDVHFWRTTDKHDVDFVLSAQTAWEVKWSGRNYKAQKYKAFTATYPNIPLKGISFDGENNIADIFKI